MRSISFFTILLFSYSICFSQKNNNVYDGCCGTKPVEFLYGENYLYIPNVFTPNGDKVNDFFKPSVSGDSLEIRNFMIFSAKGDTLLYHQHQFSLKNVETFSWNGNRFDQSPYIGLFKYRLEVLNHKSELRLIEGEACCIRCDENSKHLLSNNKCFFPVQINSIGRLDVIKSNQEKDCLN